MTMHSIPSLNDIEEVAAWRLGRAATLPIADWRSSWLNFDETRQLEFSMATGILGTDDGLNFVPPSCRPTKEISQNRRVAIFRERLLKCVGSEVNGLAVFSAWQDARLWTSLELTRSDGTAIAAQLSTARIVGGVLSGPHSEIVLWPAAHEIGFPTPIVDIPWNQRQGDVFWRGAISGSRFNLSGSGEPVLPGLRRNSTFLTTWLKQLAEGQTDDWEEHRHHYLRLAAIYSSKGSPDIDVKLVDWPHGDGKPGIDFLKSAIGQDAVSDRLDERTYRARRASRKFTLTLEGNDQPSSLREDLLSGCCLLMPKPTFEACAHFGLRAGVHYVELKRDLTDLAEKLQWCRDNDQLCRNIAENARQHAIRYLDPAFEDLVRLHVVRSLKSRTVFI